MQDKKREELIKQISTIVSSLSLLSSLTEQDKKKIQEQVAKTQKEGIPISVFKADLSGLEIIVRYMKDVENKSFKEISGIINRKLSTLYTTYNQAKSKYKKDLDTSDDSIIIPFTIFHERKLSILESLVSYLRSEGHSFIKISSFLTRNYSTIKTVYHRYKIKNEKRSKTA